MSDNTVGRITLYTPGQVFAGSFLGGPAASIIMLRRNFIRLQAPAQARRTLIWGALATCAMFTALYFLPRDFPRTAFPVTYSVMAQYIASAHQKSKAAIDQSERYARRSNWHVLWFALITLIVSGIAFFLIIFAIVLAARSFR